MDWPSHMSSDWSIVPLNNIVACSTAPEARPSISPLIDLTSSSSFHSEEPFSQNLVVQPSYTLLNANPFDVRHACNDPVERDDLSRNNLIPTRSALPCLKCNGSRQPWPTGTTSGLPNTHGHPERIDSLVCKWEHCRKPPFQTKGALMRHIDTQHIAPRSFKCPLQSCNRLFSRKDNMEEHVRRVHGVRV